LAAHIEGYVRREASIKECERAGAVDRATLDLSAAARDADLVVLCTPLAQMRGLVQRMLPALKAGAIITDVGSVKASVVREIEPLVSGAGAHFVGSHPMAGAEKTGVSHARADLFQNAVCVITPTRESNGEALQKVRDLWRGVGARTIELNADGHDELVSRSSHLPHIVAAELVNCVLSPAHSRIQATLCAQGFRDTTRIASGSPEMWRDVALANREHLARVLGAFIDDLQEIRRALQDGQDGVVAGFLERAKQRRDAWCAENPSPE
jgi:prephenate dehydrogenase